MGLTKRKDSYYVEFRVRDDGSALKLDTYGKLKRWKVGCRNKDEAKKQEAIIKTQLMTGQIPSSSAMRSRGMTFSAWADIYLGLEQVKVLRSDQRRYSVEWLKRYFVVERGDPALHDLTTQHVRDYRAWRAERLFTPKKREVECADSAVAAMQHGVRCASIQTVNHDHAALSHMLSVAMSEEFGLIPKNVAAMVKKPNPNNERDRVATPEEWEALKHHGAPHLVRFLTIAYDLGTRRG